MFGPCLTMLVTAPITEFQGPRGFPQVYSTILELAGIHSSVHRNLYRVFLLLEEGLWLHDSVVYEQFPFWCCIEKEDFMQAKDSHARVPDRTRDLGWAVSKTQVSTGMHKASDQASINDCMVTDLNEYTQSTFFLYMCVWGRNGGGGGSKNYLLMEREIRKKNMFVILGFPKNLLLNFHCLLSITRHRKQLLKSLPFISKSSSKGLVQLDFTGMTGSVSNFNNEDFLLCLVLHAKFLSA